MDEVCTPLIVEACTRIGWNKLSRPEKGAGQGSLFLTYAHRVYLSNNSSTFIVSKYDERTNVRMG